MAGNGTKKTLTQTLTLSGSAGDGLAFSFYVKGSSIPQAGKCNGVLTLSNAGIAVDTKPLNCPKGTFGFKLMTLAFNASGAYNKVVIKFTYSKASGTVWFDAVSLVR